MTGRDFGQRYLARALISDRRSDFVVRSLVPTDPVPTAAPTCGPCDLLGRDQPHEGH